jgi:hypothetical protein
MDLFASFDVKNVYGFFTAQGKTVESYTLYASGYCQDYCTAQAPEKLFFYIL